MIPMENLGQILVFIVFILVVWFIFSSLFKGMAKATKTRGYNYTIHFVNTDKEIELTDNSRVMALLQIISHSKGNNVYTVLSKRNDKTLKELLMAEYQLQANQVAITPLQNAGPLASV